MVARYKIADIDDLDLLMELSSEFYKVDDHIFEAPKARKALTDLIENERYGRIWLIFWEEKPVGYVVLTFGYSLEYQGIDAILDELYLRPSVRRR